jgi:hypothetical protein
LAAVGEVATKTPAAAALVCMHDLAGRVAAGALTLLTHILAQRERLDKVTQVHQRLVLLLLGVEVARVRLEALVAQVLVGTVATAFRAA